jgi:hypothetical protein
MRSIDNEKKLFAVILIISIVFSISSSISVSAVDNSNSDQNYINSFANQWIQNMYNEKDNVTINQTIPIYDSNDNLTGYSVSFTSKGKPDGYIILSSSSPNKNDPVIDFSLSGTDMYTTLQNKFQSSNKNSSSCKINKRLYNTSQFEYGVDITDNNADYVYDTENSFLTKNEYKSNYSYNSTSTNTNSATIFDGFVGHDGPPSGTIATQHDITGASGFTPLIMGDMPSRNNDGKTAGEDGEGNCGPTCLTNIAMFYCEERGKSQLEDTSWNYTYTRLSMGCGFYSSGTTLVQNMGPALTDYANHRGYSCTFGSDIGYDWTSYTQTLYNQNIPIYVNVQGYDDSGKLSGHSIVALGYLRLTDGQNFIRVVDEWDPTDYRYCVLYTGTGFTAIDGYPVTIS